MTTVRIVYVQHIRPARLPDGSDDPDWRLHQQLIVLADDAGHRAVPLWLRIHKGLRAQLIFDRAKLIRPAKLFPVRGVLHRCDHNGEHR